MVKHEENIDVVFRNGLKDFEVLPPPEVWDNIHPVIKSNPGTFILLRAAALIAVIMMLSFFAFRLSREESTGLGNNVMTLNEEAVSSGISASTENPVSVTNSAETAISDYTETRTGPVSDNVSLPENIMITSPELAFLRGKSTFTAFPSLLLNSLQFVASTSLQND
jgi:hypothetical protein